MFLEDLNSLRTHDKFHKSLGGICVGAALDDRQRIKDGAIIPVGVRGDRDPTLRDLHVCRIDNAGVNLPPGHVVEDLAHIFTEDQSRLNLWPELRVAK